MQYLTNLYGKKEISLQATINADAGLNFDGNNTFTDILLPKFTPLKVELLKAILRRKIDAIFKL